MPIGWHPPGPERACLHLSRARNLTARHSSSVPEPVKLFIVANPCYNWLGCGPIQQLKMGHKACPLARASSLGQDNIKKEANLDDTLVTIKVIPSSKEAKGLPTVGMCLHEWPKLWLLRLIAPPFLGSSRRGVGWGSKREEGHRSTGPHLKTQALLPYSKETGCVTDFRVLVTFLMESGAATQNTWMFLH